MISITIDNIKGIKTAFQLVPIEMIRELDKAVKKTVIKIERNAKREAPVNKQSGGGNLRQSIRGRMLGRARGIVEVGAKYGVFVHEGTRPHIIRIKNKRVLANKRTGQVFGKVVRHPGTKPNPFMERAVNESKRDVQDYFGQAVKNALKLKI